MGFSDRLWMKEIMACCDNIVTNVSNSARLQEEGDVLTLRIASVVKGNVNFGEFESCMLASLRALLPNDWSTAHEVAWSWLWDNVERLLQVNMGKPPIWEDALVKVVQAWDEATKFELRKVYNRFFTSTPLGQDYFKQSNTCLYLIADRIIDMTVDIYRNPVKMVDDIFRSLCERLRGGGDDPRTTPYRRSAIPWLSKRTTWLGPSQRVPPSS